MTPKTEELVDNRLRDIIESNNIEDAIYMIKQEFSITPVPYLDTRVY